LIGSVIFIIVFFSVIAGPPLAIPALVRNQKGGAQPDGIRKTSARRKALFLPGNLWLALQVILHYGPWLNISADSGTSRAIA